MKRVGVLIIVLAALVAPASAGAARRDAIHILPPGAVSRLAVYDLTITGHVRGHAVAYLFVDYAGCAPTLTAELRRDPHAADRYAVAGAFAEVSGWKSPFPGTDYACAYLVSHGTLLAFSRLPLAIR